MDDFSVGGAELHEALQHLRKLNRIFAASGPTLYGLRKLWQQADKPESFTILDIGSGSGDVNRRILRWADTKGLDVKITLADISAEACQEAELYYRNEPRIQVLRADLFELPSACADVVTGTQFIHHFQEEELPKVIERMLSASRWGVIINDIHRHIIAWAAVRLVTRILSRNRYILHDGPLSVAKGFRAADWVQLRHSLTHGQLTYAWRPLFRYAVTIRNDRQPSFLRS